MWKKSIKSVIILLLLFIITTVWWKMTYYTVEKTDYSNPPAGEFKLKDDLLCDKKTVFDPGFVDSRPLGKWEVNKSAAVIKLDCPIIKPDVEGYLLELHSSYAKALGNGYNILPSANLLDGKAKQFDDGLYAAIDLACFNGDLGIVPSATNLVKKIFARLPEKSKFKPFLAGALQLCNQKLKLTPEEEAEVKSKLAAFDRNKSRSKPIGFYNWTPELQQVWKFFKFLQNEFGSESIPMLLEVSNILKNDPELLKEYLEVNAFYSKLTNQLITLRIDQLEKGKTLEQLAKQFGVREAVVCFFPPSSSRETELFNKLFGGFLPENANLMHELISNIRSGKVHLKPNKDDGWYQYQAYALETLLLPSKGEEKNKLLLTASYKKRLVEAFKAMITKRREMHARQFSAAKCAVMPMKKEINPRLRIEPCVTYYLRTARAYAFLYNFLTATVGEEKLQALTGLKEGGKRELNLQTELKKMRDLFYGLYLISGEDIGLKPAFLSDETVDRNVCKDIALKWLANYKNDPDLACDTRVSIPIFISQIRGKTRLWATIGVRLSKLNASYVRAPKVRPFDTKGEWQNVDSYQLDESHYIIPVDEFAEFEINGANSLTRKELRSICDKYKTKEKILKALKNYKIDK